MKRIVMRSGGRLFTSAGASACIMLILAGAWYTRLTPEQAVYLFAALAAGIFIGRAAVVGLLRAVVRTATKRNERRGPGRIMPVKYIRIK